MSQIPTDQARLQNLPGSGVFKSSALAYKDALDRSHFIVRLLVNAYDCFKSVSHSPAISESEMYINLFKIGSGFEIYLKSVLIHHGYLVHLVDDKNPRGKTLFKIQKNTPLKIEDLVNEFGFQYDDSIQKNILGGISNKSLGFETILVKPDYRDKLGLTPQELRLVEHYRIFRNNIHLPGDFEYILRPDDQVYTWSWLSYFINEKIVKFANGITRANSFNFTLLEELNPRPDLVDVNILYLTGVSST